ncbi:hypothetical protein LEM8419_01315 [Neolewinella maritima]|uniref:Glycosyltransferase RgtA/B/C/D-like domain-containing protein n=1 Tax=Neolewinella maritima TaxID=1383882 RepID=A0ABM9AZE9_9BACT|nr:glycosyltransferase family 39 protein [Neolewinella maritima]CAH1000168.1 hypothetical protein LEM8419_01315 [Neolewinella maritima]
MRTHQIVTLLVFLAYFAVGWAVVDDYGITYDEAVQRRHGHVTVTYVADALGMDHPPLDTEGRSFSEYGMIFQMVATLIEIQLGALDDPYQYYRIRHVLGYLLFGIALYFFYRTLRLRWPATTWYPLLGTVMLMLSPRILAHAFFNPKDHILLVFYVVATYTLARFLKHRTYAALAWHVLATALALNTRFPALTLVGATVAFLIWEQVFDRPGNVKRIVQVAIYLPATLLCMLPFFPYLWVDTGSRLTGAISHMSSYTWDSTNLLFGDSLSAVDLPAYYVPAWILITTPLVYLLLLFTGLTRTITASLRHLRQGKLWSDYSSQLDFMHLGLSLAPILAIIVLHSTIYNGWRHLHFIYPGLIFLAMSGFAWLHSRYRLPAALLLALGIVGTAVNIVRMHPLQQVYFNVLVGGQLTARFDMDYWGAGYREALLQLAEQVPDGATVRVKCQNWPCVDNINALPPAARAKIIHEPDWGKADYVATNFMYPQESVDVANRVLMFAHPAVELAPRGDLVVGIYHNQ